ncbi:hypothetical protein LOS78_01850 [Paracoccus sp. MA]|uniref:hypothetical protein n=1 Tax=Paracoccus sp. MA TaxID=2895796 RepID=UPI001E3A1794|nr:hypothetical protein [Paracoccus sp. MA]UFM64243.1 hypothetical protein LOS78_01850 [Paracoccus sp. MA]
MVRLTLQNFSGEIPRKDPAYLPDPNAVEASNLKLTGGTLRPMRTIAPEFTLPASSFSLYRHKGNWYAYPSRASFVPGPVADDRLYATRDNGTGAVIAGPVGSVDAEYPLSFSRVVAAPAVSGSGPVDNDLAEIVKYAYTLVSTFGEETAPSNLSVGVKFNEGRTITLSGLPQSVQINNRFIAAKRIYRSQTSAAGVTDLYFIAQVGMGPGTDTFQDVWGVNDIQEPCPTKHFSTAPGNIRGLTGMPNGIMAAFRNRELLFCEPYQPHAWPESYRLYLDYEIVGMVASGTSLIVLTKGMPYIVQGLHPESMAQTKMETILPCVSADSIVDLGTSAIYASNDGLVQISEAGAQLISQSLWSKDEWDALTPSDIRAGRYGQAYIFSFQTASGARNGYIVDPGDGQATLTRFTRWVRLFWNDPTTNDLFMLEPNGTQINRFDAPGAAAENFVWRSKPFRFTDPIGFSAIMIEAAESSTPAQRTDMVVLAEDQLAIALGNLQVGIDPDPHDLVVDVPTANFVSETTNALTIRIGAGASENFRIRLYGDGALIHTAETAANKVQRVPSVKCRQWQIEISGTAEIMRLAMAQSAEELWV